MVKKPLRYKRRDELIAEIVRLESITARITKPVTPIRVTLQQIIDGDVADGK